MSTQALTPGQQQAWNFIEAIAHTKLNDDKTVAVGYELPQGVMDIFGGAAVGPIVLPMLLKPLGLGPDVFEGVINHALAHKLSGFQREAFLKELEEGGRCQPWGSTPYRGPIIKVLSDHFQFDIRAEIHNHKRAQAAGGDSVLDDEMLRYVNIRMENSAFATVVSRAMEAKRGVQALGIHLFFSYYGGSAEQPTQSYPPSPSTGAKVLPFKSLKRK